MAALERELGVTLFERVGRTVVSTQAGLALLEHARAMGTAADAVALAASGSAQTAEGVVSVSASEVVAFELLPPIVRQLRGTAPGLVIEIVATDTLSDLRRREADIAIRHTRPNDPELIGRLLRHARASFYASTAWVAQHGHPRTAQEALAHRFVGGDRQGTYLAYLRQHGLPLTEAHFAVRCERSLVGWQLIRQGLGIGIMMDDVALKTPGVVRVLDDVAPVDFPFWLVTHRELHTARRIRVVFDALAQALGQAT